jgi:hypothetical protein
MSAFTAKGLEGADIEAADLLAMARLDDDGAPYPSDLRRPQPGLPHPDSDDGRAACRRSAVAADDPARRQRRARGGGS